MPCINVYKIIFLIRNLLGQSSQSLTLDFSSYLVGFVNFINLPDEPSSNTQMAPSSSISTSLTLLDQLKRSASNGSPLLKPILTSALLFNPPKNASPLHSENSSPS